MLAEATIAEGVAASGFSSATALGQVFGASIGISVTGAVVKADVQFAETGKLPTLDSFGKSLNQAILGGIASPFFGQLTRSLFGDTVRDGLGPAYDFGVRRLLAGFISFFNGYEIKLACDAK